MKQWWTELDWSERLLAALAIAFFVLVGLFALGYALGLLSNLIHWASCGFTCPFWAGAEWRQ